MWSTSETPNNFHRYKNIQLNNKKEVLINSKLWKEINVLYCKDDIIVGDGRDSFFEDHILHILVTTFLIGEGLIPSTQTALVKKALHRKNIWGGTT